ncbi:MAG: ABC transporter substrate-binding protein, partial [Erysipelothrix sp.]|nr:ABC transporter substrate-binding protein [Erysipelothrix sp.]
MKKLLLLVLLCSLVISGCSVSSSKEMKTNTKSSYPQTLVDQLGREVTIEKEPKRIVSGYYISTSLLIALDLKDETVGIESKPEKRPIYSMAAPEFLELPNVGTMKEFNIEATLALEPDLVLLPIKLKDSIDVLEELGITVLAINPESDELLHETIALVAKATNRIELGDNLLNKIKTFNEKLKTLLSDV